MIKAFANVGHCCNILGSKVTYLRVPSKRWEQTSDEVQRYHECCAAWIQPPKFLELLNAGSRKPLAGGHRVRPTKSKIHDWETYNARRAFLSVKGLGAPGTRYEPSWSGISRDINQASRMDFGPCILAFALGIGRFVLRKSRGKDTRRDPSRERKGAQSLEIPMVRLVAHHGH